MRQGLRVAVVIPALNEAASIGRVLDAIPDWADDVIVADNGSADETPRLAAAHGARVVHAPRRGYGSACLAGIAALGAPDIVVFLDADFSDFPEQMDRLVDPIAAGEADFVLGSRMLGKREPGAFSAPARWGDALACALMRAFWGATYTDLGPFRAIRYPALRRLGMRDRDYGWTIEMQLKAMRKGLRIREVPIDYRRRIGRSKVSGTLRGIAGAAFKILSTIFLFALRHGVGRRQGPQGSDRVILFTRYPEPGSVKTRLIPALRADGAAALHRALTDHALHQARRYTAAEIEVLWTGGDAKSMREWFPEPARLREQSEGDLGARMTRALLGAFADGAARVVLAGSDSPDLGPETYEAAFDALDRHDIVLGPAADGGYYLIGARASAANKLGPLFTDIDWGTSQVLGQTLARIERAGLTFARTAVLDDVDRPEDLSTWTRHESAVKTLPWLSIIMPTLNEAKRLEDSLRSIGPAPIVEVIVVDGGSEDDTAAVAARRGARVFQTARGRAHQMNLGAAKAAGEVLLFLHADTRLPASYLDAIQQCLARPGAIAGAFGFATDLDSPAMRMVTAFAAVRARRFQLPYGDQALFLRKDVFRLAGGFPVMPIMEDFEFVRRLRRLGRIEIAEASAITSGDRWRRLGVWRTTLRNAEIVARYLLGADPSRLRDRYGRGAG